MNELAKRISQYQIFNFLLPGILFYEFTILVLKINEPDFKIWSLFFIYYVTGMVISRIGSILISPILKKTGFIKFEKYSDYIDTSKKDQKISLLLQDSNTYRTLISLFLCTSLVSIFSNQIITSLGFSRNTLATITSMTLFILFLFAHKKQAEFISKRIKKNNGKLKD